MIKVQLTMEAEELAEIRKLMRIDQSAPALLSAARLGASVERARLMSEEFNRRISEVAQ